MMFLTTTLLALIFTFIAILHFYWVLGGKWGLYSAIPEKWKPEYALNKPSLGFKLATLLVGLFMICFCYLALINGGFLKAPVSLQLVKYGTMAMCFIFFARAIGEFKYVGFFKEQDGSSFAEKDSKYFSPLCLLIAILLLIQIFQ